MPEARTDPASSQTRPAYSVGRYRRVAIAAAISLGIIIATGAAVRLTQSGLGCEDWPTCSEDSFVPTTDGEASESVFHAWVEFGNRLFTGVVAVAVMIAVLRAYAVRPQRADLRRWAWGLVAGVVLQIIVGAVTVRTDLNPLSVTTHFLISMFLMWNAVILIYRAGHDDPLGLSHRSTLGWTQLAAATAVLISGTIVTGTGPNSGDIRADRLPFDLEGVARIHSLTVWVFLAVTVLMAWTRRHVPDRVRPLQVQLLLILAQGGLGYLQYATGVPPLLVQVHVIGAVVVWSGSVWIFAIDTSPTAQHVLEPTGRVSKRPPRAFSSPAGADFSS